MLRPGHRTVLDLTAPLYVNSGRVSAAMVSYQVPVDHVGEVPFERAAGLLGRLGLAQLALVVDLSWAGVADLADRDEMQGSVELPVAPRFSRWRRTSPLEASMGRCRCSWRSGPGRGNG